jgi:hypothetical protein
MFDNTDVIYTVTRQMLLDDSSLIDVSKVSREAGIAIPVAITAGLHADIAAVPSSKSWQDYNGRLWDCIWMLRVAMTKVEHREVHEPLYYNLIMHTGRKTYYMIKLVVGAGDNGMPVITLMRPNED